MRSNLAKDVSASQPLSCCSSYKETLSPHLKNKRTRSKYVLVHENASSTYKIPKHIKDLMKNDIVPKVLYKPLSQSTYKKYFATLLYAEDFYIEKWTGFLLENVALELVDAKIYKWKHKHINRNEDDKSNSYTFVKFPIKFPPKDRPFILSRDFVFAQPVDNKIKVFEGVIYRVVGRNKVLAEFGDDFKYQHKPTRRYNVSFSFNRVCLKRAHQAIYSASNSLFEDFIFPSDLTLRINFSPVPLVCCNFDLNPSQKSAVSAILALDSAPPYLIENSGASAGFGLIVLESVVQIYGSRNPSCRILICTPTNHTCDALIKSLKSKILEAHMFRANAAFREKHCVPEDILPSCRYKEDSDCFICPPLDELMNFQVIFTTFMSSSLLRDKGILRGHFSHIFLVDASCCTEPEALVPLASFAATNTAIVVTGRKGQHSNWVRSDIGRSKGLRMSYFERLRMRQLYNDMDPEYVKIV
ncbi:hypothetical protein ACFE04_021527 [Oxalis oulophora]